MSKMPSDEIIDKMESLLNVASDFTRLKIMYALSEGEKNVSEIVNEVGASQSLISHQLQTLRRANLVWTRRWKRIGRRRLSFSYRGLCSRSFYYCSVPSI